ncbi:hypothetical protein [Metamycoplasma buccale]|uniref:hypothetical protein n=1 Tax=Metamycoplasma buccale TaxID=55602 RepID=UPI00398E63ED
MSNNKKWKKRKLNLENYNPIVKKQKRQLSNSWKIALTGLFLIVIPSFILFLLIGRDGWVIQASKNFDRWAMELPIALSISIIQILVVCLLIWKFKIYGPESLNFLIPITLAMNSFMVTSGVTQWYVRVLPAIALAFTAIIVIVINKNIAKRKLAKQEQAKKEELKKIKSLLD